ncbi:MAG: hypothetical protein IPM52_06200 [Bacteroidetes bacterium]|nr:hypothetical protein [Bacteroidota bacterium]
MNKPSWLLLILLLALVPVRAQKPANDTLASANQHSPHKASVYSAVLPGLGQIYNRKYWKVPIVYAGIGAFTYAGILNRNEYRMAREAFTYVSQGETYPTDNKYIKYPANDIITIRDYYRRNMEVSFLLLGVWYALNIIDATVDAHFFYYDVSEDLVLQIRPGMQLAPTMPASPMAALPAGISVRLKF